MNEAALTVFKDREELVVNAASQIAEQLEELLASQDIVHLAITGGTVGTDVLAALSEKTLGLNLEGLHVWWIDERFVPSTNTDRNELQARDAWLDASKIPAFNIHPFPSSDAYSIDSAAQAFSKEISDRKPEFDLILLGMGEDGHIASLFPGSIAESVGEWVVIERHSPKAPSERLSLSMKAINSAKEIMFLVSGGEKADALREVLMGGSDLPAALVQARSKTTWLVDSQAASKIISS